MSNFDIRSGAHFISDRTLLITSLARCPSVIIRGTAACASAQFGSRRFIHLKQASPFDTMTAIG
jgi:hypothetical protein